MPSRGGKPARGRSDELTYFGDTLEPVKTHKNATLSLAESLLRRFRIYAAERNESMTQEMTQAIRKLIEEDERATRSKRRFLERIRNAPDRGTHGVIDWRREDLHER